MDIEISVAAIHDERHCRLQFCDVCEVLLRPHTHVYPSLFRRLQKLRNDILKSELVRQEVIGPKEAVLLGVTGGHFPELFIAESCRRRCGCDENCEGGY